MPVPMDWVLEPRVDRLFSKFPSLISQSLLRRRLQLIVNRTDKRARQTPLLKYGIKPRKGQNAHFPILDLCEAVLISVCFVRILSF